MSSAPALPVIAPTAEQLAWQRQHLGVFFHVGVNTFAGLEWSDGTLPAASFDPADLDADQWVEVAKDAGARYVILTAKHHDGFCLWPTGTTDYSVASSPWRDGRGDLVAEVSEACRRHGIDFGVYLSPWDRNAECYPDAEAYDRFYQTQLRELCTGYGPLSEIWFDGAGSDGRVYDWPGVMELIAETQPHAMVFNMGEPTIRWVGNEDGLAADPVQYVTTSTDLNQYGDTTTELGQARYLPPECDVSIRKGWFWADHDRPKSLEHLLGIWYRSVGMGANLLLNLPPDDRGLIPDEDVARLQEWRAELDRRFAHPVEATLDPAEPTATGARWTARFPSPVRLDHVRLTEDYRDGQRITAHRVLAGDRELASGLTVGEQRIHVVPPIETDTLTVEVDGPDPVLSGLTAYDTGGAPLPGLGYHASTDTPD